MKYATIDRRLRSQKTRMMTELQKVKVRLRELQWKTKVLWALDYRPYVLVRKQVFIFSGTGALLETEIMDGD